MTLQKQTHLFKKLGVYICIYPASVCLYINTMLSDIPYVSDSGPVKMKVTEGDSVTLGCPVNTATAERVTKRWLVGRNSRDGTGESEILVGEDSRRGVMWNPRVNDRMVLDDSSFDLTIVTAGFHDNGLFTCKVVDNGRRSRSQVDLLVTSTYCSTCWKDVQMSVCLTVCLSVCPSVCLHACMNAFLCCNPSVNLTNLQTSLTQ